MNWRAKAIQHARALGREIHEHERGVGIEFEDGNDAYWILPGEPTSTHPVPADGPEDIDALLTEYDRVSRLRERAIHVLGHQLNVGRRRPKLTRTRDGEWSWESGGASGSMHVGGGLTSLALECDSIHELLERARAMWMLSGKLTRFRIDEHLANPSPPRWPSPPRDDDDDEGEQRETIAQALVMLGLCRALDHLGDHTPAENLAPSRLAEQFVPKGRIGRALMRLAERLPETEASFDLCNDGVMSLEFDDGYDAYELRFTSRDLARRIKELGPVAVGDEIAADFIALNEARTQVFNAICAAAAARGWHRDRYWGGFLGTGEGELHLGATRREVTFTPGPGLTGVLGSHPPHAAFALLFPGDPDFASECAAAIGAPPTTIPERSLEPVPSPDAPALAELDAATVTRMDELSAKEIDAFFADRDSLLKHNDGWTHCPGTDDSWAPESRWIELAERSLDSGWQEPVLILYRAGHPKGVAAAREYVNSCGEYYHYEMGDAALELVWALRHEFPEKARAWCRDLRDTDEYDSLLARLGDPAAQRRARHRYKPEDIERWDIEDLAEPGVVASLSPARQRDVHDHLLTWARTNHQFSPMGDDELRTAQRMGWADVGDALAHNPHLLRGLLTSERRSDGFDEPGLLLSTDALLAWSALTPSRFLARLAVTGIRTDLVALATDASLRSLENNPRVTRKDHNMSVGIYEQWSAQARRALAIVWARCRHLV